MRKPIILITVHRRYWELEKCLENIHSLLSEFYQKPIIVVVWASPEIGRLWFFQELLKSGKIHHLVYRDDFGDGVGPTTYFASLNIRKGLDFIKDNFNFPFYIIGHDADILVYPGIFRWIENEMRQDNRGILFFWENNIRHVGVWHTNFFVVSEDEKYWPPVSTKDHADVLEAQWGDSLSKIGADKFIITHNSRNQKFDHVHISEKLDKFPWKPQLYYDGVSLFIQGYIPWYRRIYNYLRRLLCRK